MEEMTTEAVEVATKTGVGFLKGFICGVGASVVTGLGAFGVTKIIKKHRDKRFADFKKPEVVKDYTCEDEDEDN